MKFIIAGSFGVSLVTDFEGPEDLGAWLGGAFGSYDK